MADPAPEVTASRLRYGRQHAPWMFAAVGAALFYVVARLLSPRTTELGTIGVIVGVSFGLYMSRLYIALADGILLMIADGNDGS